VSVGAIGDQRVLDEIVARVGRIEPVSDGRYRVDVVSRRRRSAATPAQLINMIFGNCSLWGNVEFRRLRLSGIAAGAVSGAEARNRRNPRTRRRAEASADLDGRPSHRVCPISELARLVPDVLHSPASTSSRTTTESPIKSIRLRGARGGLPGGRSKRRRRDRQARVYAPNLIGSPRVLRERARFVRELGVRVVLVSPMVIGLPAFRDLVDEFPELVYLAHPVIRGAARIAARLLFGRSSDCSAPTR